MNILPFCSIEWGTVADWFVAVGTLVLAVVAVAQDTISELVLQPGVSGVLHRRAPDCVAIPITEPTGAFLANSVYLRVLIGNTGNTTAQTVEVYARELRVQSVNGRWDIVSSFPPMNLKWANLGQPYNRIVPGMAKHCDVGHVIDPARRQLVNEDAPNLGLTAQQTSLAFDLIARPNNKTHIVGPGQYELDIQVAAENARPITRTLRISLSGAWDTDETRMLRNGVGLTVR